jgi:uncharacterized protein (DUF4213/DUF364 family)
MGVGERIIELLGRAAETKSVGRVQVGQIYSAVQLAAGGVGVAYTFPQSLGCRGSGRGDGRPLAGRTAAELLAWLGGEELRASTVGLATANALLASAAPPEGAVEGDILDVLGLLPGDRVCMVGCFLPLMEALQARQVSVAAVDEVGKPGSLPPQEVRRLLPESQVAIITATSIINGTVDDLLDLSAGCREVAVLGPSTPLAPQAFRDTPVSCLAGIRVAQAEELLRTISEGEGFRVFKRYVRKTTLRLRSG